MCGPVATIEVRRFNRKLRVWRVFLCRNYRPLPIMMMEAGKEPELSVVVPLYNEEGNLPMLQSELATALAGHDHEIIFVDDGSTDQTAEKIEERPGPGFCDSNRTGGRARLFMPERSRRRPDHCFDRRRFAKRSGRHPQVAGGNCRRSRFGLRLSVETARQIAKRITSRIANFVRSRFTRDGVRDTGCTLKAMRRECAARPHSLQRHAPVYSRLVKGAGYQLVEIPVTIAPGGSARANMVLAAAPFGRLWTCLASVGCFPGGSITNCEPSESRLNPACHPIPSTISFRSP